ncbi:MAG: PIN domain-containing protein [Candidatus Hydrogenedentota bacterium]
MIVLRIIFLFLFIFSGILITEKFRPQQGISIIGIFAGIFIALLAWGLELALMNVPKKKIFLGMIGLFLGILFSRYITLWLISGLYVLGMERAEFNLLSNVLKVLISILVIYLTMIFVIRKVPEIANILDSFKESRFVEGSPKVIDTSVIIDGRIYDILKTGFIEGNVIIPRFILEEIQQIADSSDTIKRNRGRRGLEILNRLQKELEDRVLIVEDDYEDIKEIDSKLVKIAQTYHAKLITNDYNLNKIAELQKVVVLNVNELTNAMKPVAVPGEEMRIQVVKEGKDAGQGVGYLSDGTMVVVEQGKRFIGREARVIVTSLHQTAAGRMIFTKLKEM